MSELVPVVDLNGWWSGDPTARGEVASAFDRAFTEVGFLQIVGHGISPTVRAEAFAAMDAFFAQPDDTKATIVPRDPEVYRGYCARRSESLGYTLGTPKPPDLAEVYVVGSEDVGPPSDVGLHATNVWPDEPSFRAAVWGYYLAVRQLSRELARVAGLALGVGEQFFDTVTTDALVTMRCNWYRRDADEIDLEPEQMGLGAHSDYGILTVLAADTAPGLQLLDRDDVWHDVVPVHDAFVINIGDALAVWTNDRWRSTIHRVLPAATPGGQVRRSIALFQDGNTETVVECLPTCRSDEHPPKYAPTTLGRHVEEKLRGGRRSELPVDVQHTTADRIGV